MLEKLLKELSELEKERDNALQLAKNEENILVDAIGYERTVAEKMRASFYKDAEEANAKIKRIKAELKSE